MDGLNAVLVVTAIFTVLFIVAGVMRLRELNKKKD